MIKQTQVGGDHYSKLKIQPIDFIHGNKISYMEGNVIKYVVRWRDKGGIEDLRKARHYLDLLIEMETKCSVAIDL
jgi:hypothetical protein